MVRDVKPKADDLRHLTQELTEKCLPPISIELLALYLPAGSIKALPSKVMATRVEGD